MVVIFVLPFDFEVVVSSRPHRRVDSPLRNGRATAGGGVRGSSGAISRVTLAEIQRALCRSAEHPLQNYTPGSVTSARAPPALAGATARAARGRSSGRPSAS